MSQDPLKRIKARLTAELQDIQRDPPEGCSAQPLNPDDILSLWTATIRGPKGTPYENGHFDLTISFPNTYPRFPPLVKMTSPVYHPNIDHKSGYIDINILHDDWSPILTVPKILLSLQALLSDPDCEDAVSPEIAWECELKREEFERTAREWTRKYAMKGEGVQQNAEGAL